MLVDEKRAREFWHYRGLAIRTIIQTVWLILTGLAAYFAIQYLLDAEMISYGLLRVRLAIPGWVPDWGILAGMILVFMIVMQFFFIMGYSLISPQGRIRPGKPTMRKTVVDPLEEKQYRNR
jgi:hypothetical protein